MCHWRCRSHRVPCGYRIAKDFAATQSAPQCQRPSMLFTMKHQRAGHKGCPPWRLDPETSSFPERSTGRRRSASMRRRHRVDDAAFWEQSCGKLDPLPTLLRRRLFAPGAVGVGLGEAKVSRPRLVGSWPHNPLLSGNVNWDYFSRGSLNRTVHRSNTMSLVDREREPYVESLSHWGPVTRLARPASIVLAEESRRCAAITAWRPARAFAKAP